MEHTAEQLLEARRQITSTLHKLHRVVETLEQKPDPARYRSQLTLTRRRIDAFELAVQLIDRELDE